MQAHHDDAVLPHFQNGPAGHAAVSIERLERRMVNGKHVQFSLTNERETAEETSSDNQEKFHTVKSCEHDIKKEIMSNLQPLKQ